MNDGQQTGGRTSGQERDPDTDERVTGDDEVADDGMSSLVTNTGQDDDEGDGAPTG